MSDDMENRLRKVADFRPGRDDELLKRYVLARDVYGIKGTHGGIEKITGARGKHGRHGHGMTLQVPNEDHPQLFGRKMMNSKGTGLRTVPFVFVSQPYQLYVGALLPFLRKHGLHANVFPPSLSWYLRGGTLVVEVFKGSDSPDVDPWRYFPEGVSLRLPNADTDRLCRDENGKFCPSVWEDKLPPVDLDDPGIAYFTVDGFCIHQ
jgi:hypothetical protein